MKTIITKKELKCYMEVVEEALKPIYSEDVISDSIEQFNKMVREGLKEGAVKMSFNKKLDLVYEIDPKFICKVLKLFSKYLAVVIPQVMSIYKLTANLGEDMMDIYEECGEEEDEEEE